MSTQGRTFAPKISIVTILVGLMTAGITGFGTSPAAANPADAPEQPVVSAPVPAQPSFTAQQPVESRRLATSGQPVASKLPITARDQPAWPAGVPSSGMPITDPVDATQSRVSTDSDIDIAKIPSSGTPSKPLEQPVLKPGTPVVHEFDVVVANLYASPDDFPPGPPEETLTHAKIDSVLSDAAQWWSDNTKLAFDFNQHTQYATINTTCDTIERDAMAKMGKPFDQLAYTATGRDLLIFQTNGFCGPYNGLALTMPGNADLFVGGIFHVVVLPADGQEFTAFTAAHEFGHTIGLLHSNVADCRNSVRTGDDQVGPLWDGTFTPDSCASQEYRDLSTIMGNQFAFSNPVQVSLNSLQKRYLGVAWDDVDIVAAPVSRHVVTISRRDLDSATLPHGAEVTVGGNSFGLEFLPADTDDLLGFDGLVTRAGVFITSAYDIPEYGRGTNIVTPVGLRNGRFGPVMHPVPLGPSETYVSQDGTVRLRTLSVGDTTAQVEITVTNQPGLPGDVSVKQEAGALIAKTNTDALVPVTTTYQWFRNGRPITGATNARYTPALPDPNAVYRVEAGFSAAGHAATTRYSRGIIPDNRQLVAHGGDLTLSLRDQNGNQLQCENMLLDLDITAGDHPLGRRFIKVQSTAEPQVCKSSWSIPLTGVFQVTASNLEETNANLSWMNMYWQPATVTATVSATRASAGLMIGVLPAPMLKSAFNSNDFEDFDTPRLFTATGSPPMAVTVSVTDDRGDPAEGVPVSLSSGVPGLAITPATPTTDRYGHAYATVAWDRTVAPLLSPDYDAVEVTVPGVDTVAGSPAPIVVYGIATSQFLGWVDGDSLVPVGGDQSGVLRVRVWDEAGNLVADQADRLQSVVAGAAADWAAASVTQPVWDAAEEDYLVTVTSRNAQTVWAAIVLDDGVGVVLPAIDFIPGSPVRLDGVAPGFSASNGSCDGSDVAVGTMYGLPTDEFGNTIDSVDKGVVFSLPDGSPLAFASNPVVTRHGRTGGMSIGYSVQVTSRLSGTFDVNVRSADGSLTGTLSVVVTDALIDPDASRVTLGGGPALANGADAYTVKANLVSRCHVPVTGLSVEKDSPYPNSYAAVVDAVDAATGEEASGVRISALKADPAQPGLYTAKVTALRPGRYALTVNEMELHVDPMWATRTWVTVAVNPEPLVAEFRPDKYDVTLSLPEDLFEVDRGACGGRGLASPDHLVARVKVTDWGGKPAAGIPLAWETDVPLLLGTKPAVTGPDGTAEVRITMDVAKWDSSRQEAEVRVTVAGLAPRTAMVRINELMHIGDASPVACWWVAASVTGGTSVPADGKSSWTLTVHAAADNGDPLAGRTVRFSVNGSAKLSEASAVTGPDGVARVTVTDAVAETVAVEAAWVDAAGDSWAVPGSPVPVSFKVVATPVKPDNPKAPTGGTVSPAGDVWLWAGLVLILAGPTSG